MVNVSSQIMFLGVCTFLPAPIFQSSVCCQLESSTLCVRMTWHHSEGRVGGEMGGVFEAALNIDASTPLPFSKLSKSSATPGRKRNTRHNCVTFG